MKKILQFAVLALVLPIFVSNTFGQDEQPPPKDRSPLQADRPDFTDSPFTVDEGMKQLEMGWQYTEHGNGSSADSNQFPQMLFRYGLETDWELRIGWNGYTFVDDMDDVAGDMNVGLKWHWSDQTEKMPAQGLILGLGLPTGHDSGDDVDPSLTYVWSWEVDDTSSVSGNIGIAAITDLDTDDHFGQGSFSLAYNRSLNDRMNWFAEYYTNFPAAEDEDAEHVVQTGLTYMVNPDLSLDCIIGAGLNHQADDFLVGVGLTYRF